MRHTNNGRCLKCQEILNQYPGLHPALRAWFEKLQEKHPEAHCSCAGRGEQDQIAKKLARLSRANWKESSHNWNAALDLFELGGNLQEIYERTWFDSVIAPAIAEAVEICGERLKWYGAPGSPFWELPHVEIADWRRLASNGVLKLVA